MNASLPMLPMLPMLRLVLQLRMVCVVLLQCMGPPLTLSMLRCARWDIRTQQTKHAEEANNEHRHRQRDAPTALADDQNARQSQSLGEPCPSV